MIDLSGIVYNRNLDAMLRHPRVIANKGGTRSGKTYNIVALLVWMAANCKRRRDIDIVSESLPHLKRGTMKDIDDILDAFGMVEGDEYEHNRTDHEFTFRDTGSVIRFFSADNWGKVKGSHRDILFINEANRVAWEIYRQLAVRTTETIVIDWNPDAEFWYEEHGINTDATTIEIKSTYKDNEHLTGQQVADIERNKDRDPNWWRVYGLGETGLLIGAIYTNVHHVDDIPDDVRRNAMHVYGLDFGFSNDPTALVDVYIDATGRRVFVDEQIYQSGLLNGDIAAIMRQNGIKTTTEIYADAAEPKSIAELRRYGFNVKEAYKRDLLSQIQFLQSFDLFITKASTNVIKEARNYKWKTTADGKTVNEPVDIWNHAMDATRYAVFTPLMGRPKLSTSHSQLSRLPQ